MTSRSLPLSVLALTGALALTACTTEPTPSAPNATASTAPSGAADPGASAEPPSSDGEAVIDPAAVLEVEDQMSEGPTVNVTAAVTTGGWVVVASDGGRNVLGAGMVPPGAASTTVQVSLADIILEPTELVARLYDDSNADGLYGAGDRPVSNDDADDDDTGFAGESETFSFAGKDVVVQ